MFQSALPQPERSKYDPLRPLLADEQWVEYALLTCNDNDWLDIISEIEAFDPKNGVARTGYDEVDKLDREMYEKYVLKRGQENGRQ